MEELAQQIKLSISEASQKGYERQDLIFLIQLLIKGPPAINNSPLCPANDNVITSESEKYGFVNLNEIAQMRLLTHIYHAKPSKVIFEAKILGVKY